MERTRLVSLVLAWLLASTAAWAQSGALVGTVTDASGGVLPGVTVEAASPALIERSRTASTDGAGFYRIIELRPGTYTVTFTLAGFQVVKRENIELTTGFTATVNAALQLGSIDESITVTGESPLVDVQNTVVQTLLSREVLEAIPLGQSLAAVGNLTLGGTRRDVGGNAPENQQTFGIRGVRSTDYQTFRDGMNIGSLQVGGNSYASTNPSMFEEMAIQTGGAGATAESVGVAVNMISKTGGNVFAGTMTTSFSHKALEWTNLDDALRDRGAATPTEIRKRQDVHGSFGGPIIRDKLWFIGGARYWIGSDVLPSNYFNATQGTLKYTPDLSRPAYSQTYWRMGEGRLTWQATPRNQITGMFEKQLNCDCFRGIQSGTASPEARGHHTPTVTRVQVRWSSPVTSRLLLQFGSAYQLVRNDRLPSGGSMDDRVITELSNNYTYGGHGWQLVRITNMGGFQKTTNANQNFTVSYVTGGHNFQVGFRHLMGLQNYNAPRVSGPGDELTFRFRNGVPDSFDLFASPYYLRQRGDELSFFASDQWTLGRLTLNPGLRFDGVRGSTPAQNLPAGLYVPERSFPAQKGIPNLKDLNPRVGAAYDLFGTGKTAIKAHLARSVWQNMQISSPGSLISLVNPVINVVESANRPWNDANGNFYPDCDLRNPLANGECGPFSDTAFGTARPTTTLDDELVHGWHNRGYTWQGSISVQHELMPGVSMDVGYSRTWHGNFEALDNVLVTPADYDPYCVTAPVDPRLPGGGGQEICGLYDIKPEKFAQIERHRGPASKFGKQTEVYNGIEATINIRRAGYLFSGGVITGANTTDRCFVVDSPQELRHCRVAPPWSAGTQVKLHGIAPLRWGLQLSGVFQILPSIPEAANHRFTNAEIAPSLHRNLSGRVRNVNVALLEPESVYLEGWNSQLDLRLARVFQWGRNRLLPTLDIYNLFNANPVLGQITTFGSNYRNVTNILGPRVVRLGVQFNF